jgi:membrane protein implicated in regulation of membrane protease activity
MISALFEVILYVVAEMLSYIFVRVFFCVASSACLAVVIYRFVPDRALHSAIIAVVAVTGLIVGIIWEMRAPRDTQSDGTTRDGKL